MVQMRSRQLCDLDNKWWYQRAIWKCLSEKNTAFPIMTHACFQEALTMLCEMRHMLVECFIKNVILIQGRACSLGCWKISFEAMLHVDIAASYYFLYFHLRNGHVPRFQWLDNAANVLFCFLPTGAA